MSKEGSMAMLGFVLSEDENVLVLAGELSAAVDITVKGKAVLADVTVTGDVLVAGTLYCKDTGVKRYYIPSHHPDIGTINTWCQVVAPYDGYVCKVSIVPNGDVGASGGTMRISCGGYVLSGFDITIPDATLAGAVITSGDIPSIQGSYVTAGDIIYLNVTDDCTNSVTACVTFELVRG